MKKLQFEATDTGNMLSTLDGTIRATVRVPDGASYDYGYLAMKNAIIAAYHGTEPLEFWYDGQEQYLDPEAAEGEPEVEIREGADDMKLVSIDNGIHFVEPEEAIAAVGIDTLVSFMDAEVRERVHFELAPCSDIEFLRRYLEIAPCDLIVG